VSDAVCMPRRLLACVVALLLLCTPAHAEEEYSAWRAFGIDEIRLGGMKHNLEVRNNQSGVGYTVSPEGGIDVNGEVLFASPWPQPSNAVIDFLFRPRPMLGATVSTQGDTSQVYLGAAWTLPLFNVLFVEATFGGAYHDGPLTSSGPNYHEAYGCRVNFHESGSLGVKLGENWRVMATVEHMSNGKLCEPNAGLTNVGARFGYKFNP
jgi:lipid A 3-O-deacylase